MANAAQIRKVITGGTAHQRATLLANHIGLWISPDNTAALTDEEFKALDDSFKTDFDIRVYRKFKALDEQLRFRLTGLSQLGMEHDLTETNIFHFNYARRQLAQTEELLGYLGFLVAEKCGKEKQIAVWKELLKSPFEFPIGAKPEIELEVDEDGKELAFFRLKGGDFPQLPADLPPISEEDISKDHPYFYSILIRRSGLKLTELRTIIKTWIVTLREVMQTHSFNVRPYKTFLDNLEKKVRRERSLPFTLSPEEIRKKIEASESQEDKGRYSRLLKEDEQTRSLFWKPYDEIEIDQVWREILLDNFNVGAINNAPK
jgi:hypothetical protein